MIRQKQNVRVTLLFDEKCNVDQVDDKHFNHYLMLF